MKYSPALLLALAIASPALAQQSEYAPEYAQPAEAAAATQEVPVDESGRAVDLTEDSAAANDPTAAASRPIFEARPQADTTPLVSTNPNGAQAVGPSAEVQPLGEEAVNPVSPASGNTGGAPNPAPGEGVPSPSSSAGPPMATSFDMSTISVGVFATILGIALMGFLLSRARSKPKVRKRSREEAELYQERDYSSFDEKVKKRLNDLNR